MGELKEEESNAAALIIAGDSLTRIEDSKELCKLLIKVTDRL